MTNVSPAKRLNGVSFSGIRDVFERVNRLEREGRDIVHMEIGRPDFDTPAPIKQAAKDALENGFVHYTSSAGILELREELARKLEEDNGIQVSPDEIVVTAGASEGIFSSFLTFLDPGDEVIIPEPMYVYYRDWADFAGANTVPLPVYGEANYQPNPEDIEELINERTKMLVLNYPHNPTGVTLDPGILGSIADLAIDEDLMVLSDEIYEQITYGEVDQISPASLPGMEDRTLTVNGFSKAYSMTGWRLGYVAGTRALIEPLLKTRQHTSNCPCSFGQKGALAGLRKCDEQVASMVEQFGRRKDLVVDALESMAGVEFVEPRGAFYAFPMVRGTEMDSHELVNYLLEEANVALVPGAEFGESGQGHVRIAYSTGYQQLEQGLSQMERALAKL
ncbi:pyridoxal phosphate-dependent aminotransferase [Candidatus Bipolaricaulota bacterium]|nr:pyridoxal phosphate-dependent aminotransferase [Candidatus Bipolaricaulota bacterium]